MYTLSQLRNQVDALQRKYARELAVYRLRPLAEDFSQQWAIALSNRQPAPQPQPFIRRIAQRGFCFNTFMALDNYLERCRSEGIIPHCQGMLHSLLPQLPYDRLRSMLQWIPRPGHQAIRRSYRRSHGRSCAGRNLWLQESFPARIPPVRLPGSVTAVPFNPVGFML